MGTGLPWTDDDFIYREGRGVMRLLVRLPGKFFVFKSGQFLVSSTERVGQRGFNEAFGQAAT